MKRAAPPIIVLAILAFTAYRMKPERRPIPDAISRATTPAGKLLEDYDPEETFPVLGVVDGETIRIRARDKEERVRLFRINTPEPGQPGCEEATEAVRQFVAGQRVKVEFETPGWLRRDDQGRVWGYVFVDDLHVNLELVRLGLSPFWATYGGGRMHRQFVAAEKEAKAAKRGLWASSDEPHDDD